MSTGGNGHVICMCVLVNVVLVIDKGHRIQEPRGLRI